jgi:uncharacterized membrane protein YvbJ
MKKSLIAITVLSFVAILFFSCSNEAIINQTIDSFQNAVNNNNLDGVKATLSPYCDWNITGVQVEILNYLYGTYTPLSYTNRSISVNSPWADVTSTAKYYGTDDTTAWFRMRKNDGFFSFLNPEWKIKEIYDLNNHTDPVWKKIQQEAASK